MEPLVGEGGVTETLRGRGLREPCWYQRDIKPLTLCYSSNFSLQPAAKTFPKFCLLFRLFETFFFVQLNYEFM